MRHPRTRRLALYVLPALLAAASWSAAAEKDHEAPALVDLTIHFADEDPVTIKVAEGGMATYRSYPYGVGFGVIPEIREAAGGAVQFRLVTLEGRRPHYHPGETLEGESGWLDDEVVVILHASIPVGIRLSKSREPDEVPGPCVIGNAQGEVGGLSVRASNGSC